MRSKINRAKINKDKINRANLNRAKRRRTRGTGKRLTPESQCTSSFTCQKAMGEMREELCSAIRGGSDSALVAYLRLPLDRRYAFVQSSIPRPERFDLLFAATASPADFVHALASLRGVVTQSVITPVVSLSE